MACVLFSRLQVGPAGRRQLILPTPPPRPAGQRPRKKMVSYCSHSLSVTHMTRHLAQEKRILFSDEWYKKAGRFCFVSPLHFSAVKAR